MARGKGKKSLNQDVDETYVEMFDKICANVGGHKHRTMEAAVEVFDNLSLELQTTLKSYNQPQRELALELIRKLKLPHRPRKPARNA